MRCLKIETTGLMKFREFQVELEAKFKRTQLDLTASLERNSELERDLIKIKTDLEKSLRWNTSSQVLVNLNNQRSSNVEGISL